MMVHSGGIASIATAIKTQYSALHIPKSEEPTFTCMVVFSISFSEVARYSNKLAIHEVPNKPKYLIIQVLAVPIQKYVYHDKITLIFLVGMGHSCKRRRQLGAQSGADWWKTVAPKNYSNKQKQTFYWHDLA